MQEKAIPLNSLSAVPDNRSCGRNRDSLHAAGKSNKCTDLCTSVSACCSSGKAYRRKCKNTVYCAGTRYGWIYLVQGWRIWFLAGKSDICYVGFANSKGPVWVEGGKLVKVGSKI